MCAIRWTSTFELRSASRDGQPIAQARLGASERARRKLQHRACPPHDPTDAPRGQTVDEVEHASLLVDEGDVDREAHKTGVDRLFALEDYPCSVRKASRSHQAA